LTPADAEAASPWTSEGFWYWSVRLEINHILKVNGAERGTRRYPHPVKDPLGLGHLQGNQAEDGKALSTVTRHTARTGTAVVPARKTPAGALF
jgi:hypothetical protein